MPGKKPKERQRYMLRINDTLVEVTREVYLAWYQAGRKERYQVEKMQRHGVCSMEELQEKGYDCSFSVVSPEEIVIRLSEIQKLEEAMGYLAKEEAELITLLFFEEFTVKETAQYFGCCTKTIRNRRKKVLEKLKELLQKSDYILPILQVFKLPTVLDRDKIFLDATTWGENDFGIFIAFVLVATLHNNKIVSIVFCHYNNSL